MARGQGRRRRPQIPRHARRDERPHLPRLPHSYRRAWATIALNEKELPIDVVSEVLKHSDIATTRQHYAPTKSERARAALVGMRPT